ncbi:hypothetical protein BUALT_Bualt08G0039100 [Buddleja alternifolia]|uniref:Cytochrome P450 76AD1-like protein n=1 Tax=Buddleja alternifolia TaxID=168488 RepID=A0AAV6XAR2_9LAMI|nr:hypothetical protein BUALT_Bualt08G0039100 [Buddleja alternifolia]
MAQEILQKNDQVCSGRAVPSVAQAMNHHKASILWLPVGTKWRKLRKICKEQMSTIHHLDAKNCLGKLQDYLQECSNRGRAVDICEIGFKTSLNLLSSTFFSVDLAHLNSSSTQEMMEKVQVLIKNLGTPNLADYIPLVKLIDPQGLKHKTEVSLRRLLEILDRTLNPRFQSRGISTGSPRKKDLLEALLDFNQEDDSDFSLDDIKHLLIVSGVRLAKCGWLTLGGDVKRLDGWPLVKSVEHDRVMVMVVLFCGWRSWWFCFVGGGHGGFTGSNHGGFTDSSHGGVTGGVHGGLGGDEHVAADTITDSVQWTMAELLRNPEKMSKVKDELSSIIAENKQVEESDISRLSYLNAVIKETFRCHPAVPFLIPHKAETDITINGYIIPKNAQILVNVWAIGRDSRIWSNPDSFEPERFLDGKIDYKGHDFELITFGSGRRICPGMLLAHLMVHLMVATLIHNFNWKLEPGIEPEQLDMNEMYGISLHKAVPLKASPVKH